MSRPPEVLSIQHYNNHLAFFSVDIGQCWRNDGEISFANACRHGNNR